MFNIFGGYLAIKCDPKWAEAIRPKIDDIINRMLSAGLVVLENDDVVLTKLGNACGRSSLKFESTLQIIDTFKQLPLSAIQPVALLALIQVIKEMDDVYTPLNVNQNHERVIINDFMSRYQNTVLFQILQRRIEDQPALWKRCKRAAMLFDWISGISVEKIEHTYTANPFNPLNYGDILKITDTSRFHLQSVLF